MFTDTIRTAYFSVIHTLLTYGILVWGLGCGWQKVFVLLQTRAVRIIAKLLHREVAKQKKIRY